MMRRHVAGPEMHLRRAPIVARDEAVQDLGEEAALLRAEPAHDAEVDRDDVAVRVDQQIALVHVGMKEAVAHGVAQERAQHRQTERAADRGPPPPAASRSAIGMPSIHSIVSTRLRRALPVDARHAETRSSDRPSRDVLGHLRDGGRLEPQIHLELGRALQRVDDGHRPQPPRRRDGTARSVRAAK